MTLSQELAYVCRKLPDFAINDLEFTIDCRLTGLGFESWEGIAGLSSSSLLFSSAPGVFSSGRTLTFQLSELRRVVVAQDQLHIEFASQTDEKEVVLSQSGTTREDDWVKFCMVGILRSFGFPKPGERVPAVQFIPPGVFPADVLAEALKGLGALFPGFSEAVLWQSAALLASERPSKARELLDSLQNLSEKNSAACAVIYAIAAFLSGKFRLAREIISRFGLVKKDRAMSRLGILVDATLDGLPGEERHYRSSSNNSYPFLRVYQAQHFFQIDSFASLYQTCWGLTGLLLEAWQALGASRLSDVEESLEKYRKCPEALPIEVLRLEAAMRHSLGEFELAFSMLQAARITDLNLPLIVLAVNLSRTDVKADPPTEDQLPMLSAEQIAQWVDFLLACGDSERARELLDRSSSRRETIPIGLQAHFWVLEAEADLKSRSAAAALSMAMKVLSLAGIGDVQMGKAPGTDQLEELLFHQTFKELVLRACLTAAACLTESGDPVSALKYLAWAEVAGETASSARFVEKIKHAQDAASSALEGFDRISYGEGVSPDLSAMSRWKALSNPIDRRLHRLVEAIGGESVRFPCPPGECGPSLRPYLSAGEGGGVVQCSDLWGSMLKLRECISRPLLVAVMGEFNAGKSTFLNALLGGKILPTGVRPTTRLPCVIRWGPMPLLQETGQGGFCAAHPIEETFAFVDEQSVSGIAEEQSFLDVRIPNPVLKDVWFVDMPGLNSRYSRHQRASEEFIHEADVIIWVSNAAQLGQATELAAMKKLIRPYQKVLPVLNRIDEIGLDERPEVIEAFSRLVKDRSSEVIAVSARDAANDSGVRDSWKPWLERLVANSAHLKEMATRGRIQSIRNGFSAFVRNYKDDWEVSIRDLKNLSSLLEPRQSNFPTLDSNFESAIEAVVQGFRNSPEIQEGLESVRQARIVAEFEDGAQHFIEIVLKTEMQEAESMLFPCLGAWRGLSARFPHPTLNLWLTAFRGRSRLLKRLLHERISRAFWEASGRQGNQSLTILKCVQKAVGEWMIEFREALHTANACLLLWCHARLKSTMVAHIAPVESLFNEMGSD